MITVPELSASALDNFILMALVIGSVSNKLAHLAPVTCMTV